MNAFTTRLGRSLQCLAIALLLLAGATKAWVVGQYRIELAGMTFALPYWAMSAYEMLLGAWLLSGVAPRLSWRLALATFSAFLVVALYQVVHGHPSCGCFGSLEVRPALMAPVDAVIAGGLALDLKRLTARDASRRSLTLGGAAFVLSLAVTFVSGERRAAGDPFIGVVGGAAVLYPEDWIGRDFPLARSISINADLRDGRWRIILMTAHCSDCKEKLPSWLQGLTASEERTAFVEGSGRRTGDVVERILSSGAAFGTLNQDRKWFVKMPLILHLDNGKVVSVE